MSNLGFTDRDGQGIELGDKVWFDTEAYWYDLSNGGIPLKDSSARTRNDYDLNNKHHILNTKEVRLYIDDQAGVYNLLGLEGIKQYRVKINV